MEDGECELSSGHPGAQIKTGDIAIRERREKGHQETRSFCYGGQGRGVESGFIPTEPANFLSP